MPSDRIDPPNDSPPLILRCEGSGARHIGYCPMCARVFASDVIPDHDRLDILAMLKRGDFDE